MDTKRRIKRVEINNDLRDANNFIKRSEETIARLKSSENNSSFVSEQINKLSQAIVEKQNVVRQLSIDMEKLNNKELDNIIKEEYRNINIIIRKKEEERLRAKKIKDEEKKKKKEISQKYWKNIVSTSRFNRQRKKDWEYGYRYYVNVTESLPDYMKNNLAIL